MEKSDEFTNLMVQATAGMREAITEILKAHIAATLGGECSIQQMAKKVFEKPSWHHGKESWIDEELERAIRNETEKIIREWIKDNRPQLEQMVKDKILSLDIAGKIANEIIKKLGKISED